MLYLHNHNYKSSQSFTLNRIHPPLLLLSSLSPQKTVLRCGLLFYTVWYFKLFTSLSIKQELSTSNKTVTPFVLWHCFKSGLCQKLRNACQTANNHVECNPLWEKNTDLSWHLLIVHLDTDPAKEGRVCDVYSHPQVSSKAYNWWNMKKKQAFKVQFVQSRRATPTRWVFSGKLFNKVEE